LHKDATRQSAGDSMIYDDGVIGQPSHDGLSDSNGLNRTYNYPIRVPSPLAAEQHRGDQKWA
jgi:hypothetical protein